jgi:hypothetical protein
MPYVPTLKFRRFFEGFSRWVAFAVNGDKEDQPIKEKRHSAEHQRHTQSIHLKSQKQYCNSVLGPLQTIAYPSNSAHTSRSTVGYVDHDLALDAP